MMSTVVLSPAQVKAISQQPLIALTVHIVKQDGTRAIAKVSQWDSCHGWATPKLPAYHLSILHIPLIITHCAPDVSIEDLHTALTAAVPIHHTDSGLLWMEQWRDVKKEFCPLFSYRKSVLFVEINV